MNNNFGFHFHLKTDLHIIPQSEVYIRQFSQEDDVICNNHVRTYSLGIEKVSSDKCKQSLKWMLGNMNIIKLFLFLSNNKQDQNSKLMLIISFNSINNVQQNSYHQALTFMNSNYVTSNFIKLVSNNEFFLNEEDNRPFTPKKDIKRSKK